MLQNLGSATTETIIGEPLPPKTARQEFHDFMSKSPGEMIKEKLLREIGLTEEEYDALPPEMKAKVDELIAQRMKEDIERKIEEKAQEQVAKVDGGLDEEQQAARPV